MELIFAGISDALTLTNIFYIVTGVFLGIIVGAIPGLNTPMALALAVPLTYYMSPLSAITFLVGIAKGGAFGGAIAAILLNTPGSPEATPATFDGYPLAKRGKGLKALKMALYSSFTGDTFSDIVLFTVAAPLAIVAIMMGPAEMTAVFLFSFTVVASLAGNSMIRGLLAAVLGAYLACIGLDIETGQPRLTFGIPYMLEGLPLIPLAIGLLALSEIIIQIEVHIFGREKDIGKVRAFGRDIPPEDKRVSFREFISCWRTLLRSALIGTGVGAVPGLSGMIAGFLGYGSAKRASKNPEEFGTGKLEGIAATEAATSAVNGANLIPLLAIGVPGSMTVAILMGAFLIHGVSPGPLIFQEHGRLIYGIFAAMMFSNFVNFLIGNLGLRVFALIVNIPKSVIFPIVLVLCIAGAFSNGNIMFPVAVMMVFAVIGYFLRKLDFPFATFIIGFVLGSLFEESVRQTVVLFRNRPAELLSHPVVMIFVVLTVLAIVRIVLRTLRDSRERRERLSAAPSGTPT